ncbi:hypothetical protein PVK06_020912 [Gossypium arboreum]|uniref:Uncharacterized protein n=1 Tax=Gossypium arboreum TaxID=29729 RepID=A0ABR0PNL0_GOSAR|nr:hypothetical protein PVK06_020912 [Gossypium arboreum]
MQSKITSEKTQDSAVSKKQTSRGGGAIYGPWMVVKKRSRLNLRISDFSRADSRKRIKLGSQFDALTNMETIDLEAGPNKGRDEQTVKFKETLKAGESVENLRLKNRETSKAMRMDSPNVGGSVGRSIDGSTFVTRVASLFPSKAGFDPSSSALSQPMIVMDMSCIRPGHQDKEPGGPPNLSRNIVNLNLPSVDNFKTLFNSSSLTPMTISCFNPVFVGQEENKENNVIMQSKPDSLVSEPIEFQVLDSLGGLNPNRHSDVSFKEKGPVDGIIQGGCMCQSLALRFGAWEK